MRLAQALCGAIQLLHALKREEGRNFAPLRRVLCLSDASAEDTAAAFLQLRAQQRGLFLVLPAPDGEELRRGGVGREAGEVELVFVFLQVSAVLEDGGNGVAVRVKIRYRHIKPRAFAAASSRSSAFSTYSRGQARFTRWKSS